MQSPKEGTCLVDLKKRSSIVREECMRGKQQQAMEVPRGPIHREFSPPCLCHLADGPDTVTGYSLTCPHKPCFGKSEPIHHFPQEAPL